MATHSSVLAWRIPGTGEPRGQTSMGSHRVGHDWSDLAVVAVTWELDHQEGWVPKNLCFWIVCWRRVLRVPWTARRLIQSILKEINPEYSLEGLMLKLSILEPCDAKSQLIGKDPDAGKDWRQEEEETTEDEMVGWRHWLDGHEFEQALGADDGQGSLACCGPWVTKSQTQLNDWTELNLKWLPFQILGKRNNLEFK